MTKTKQNNSIRFNSTMINDLKAALEDCRREDVNHEQMSRDQFDKKMGRIAIAAYVKTVLSSDYNKEMFKSYQETFNNSKKKEKVVVTKNIVTNITHWNRSLDNDDIDFFQKSLEHLFNPGKNIIDYVRSDIEDMAYDQGFLCDICHQPMSIAKDAKDPAVASHRIPKHICGDAFGIDNIRAAHKSCNCKNLTNYSVPIYF